MDRSYPLERLHGQNTVDNQLGCSSRGDDDWRQVDTLELHACNDGSPWHEQRLYSHTEEFLGKEMQQHLGCSMQQVAEEEKQHAIATNSFYQGVPSITVIVDGNWSKRALKHSLQRQ